MRAASLLGINNVAGRPGRSILLALAVALSTVLVAAVACALSSLNAGLEHRVASTIGRADIRVKHVGDGNFTAELLNLVRDQPETAVAAPRSRGPLPLISADGLAREVAVADGIDPALEYQLIDAAVDEGRAIERDGEVVLARSTVDALNLTLGDSVEVERFGPPLTLTLVGIRKPHAIEPIDGARATTTIATLESATGYARSLREIAVVLQPGHDPQTIESRWQPLVPEGILVQLTERTASRIGQSIRANQFGSILASALAFIASAFIVMTGLTTSLAERQRELAILRCIGARRSQLAAAQVLSGAIIGLCGAIVGMPAGIALAWIMTRIFPDRLPAGLVIWPTGLALAAAGAVGAGFVGALWPAWMASRTSPLAAMASSARPTRPRTIALLGFAGLVGIALQLFIVGRDAPAESILFSYLFFGLPVMFVGYFLLGVPVAVAVVSTVGPLLARALRLPPALLTGNARATPIRAGFTAGALMVGLSMMTIIWTNGSALLRDWIGSIKFPDGFAHPLDGPFSPQDQRTIAELPFVDQTCAITLQKVETSAFGVRDIRDLKTTFVAFEPERFFSMAELRWVAGDPAYAIARLAGADRDSRGPAIIVAREFLVQRTGFSVGDTFTVDHAGETISFEIVGAVSSPGLDLVSKYFDIGKEYADQAIHSVFGSRDDLIRLFGNDAIDLVQFSIRPDAPIADNEVGDAIRALFPGRSIAAGSGREVRAGIVEMGRGWMRIASIIAAGAMLIGCAGVGNIVVAGIDARRFEFGVMRAVGANASVLARLVTGEVVMVALTACIIGTLMGLQAAWAEQRLLELIAGLELDLRPPVLPIALGWAVLMTLTLLATAPIIWRLSSLRPLALLRARG